MATSEALKKDIAKVLVILEYQHDLNGKSEALHILNQDLRRFDVSIETLAIVLTYLGEHYPTIQVERVYDFVNGEPPEEQWVDSAFYTMAKIKVPDNFGGIMKQMREEIAPKTAQENNNPFYNFHLTRNGKLSREVNGKLQEYKFQEDKLSHRIVKTFLKGSAGHLIDTQEIASAVSCTEPQVRSAINGIRRKVRLHFSPMQGKDFVIGKRGSGYSLGKNVRILLEH